MHTYLCHTVSSPDYNDSEHGESYLMYLTVTCVTHWLIDYALVLYYCKIVSGYKAVMTNC